MQWDKNKKPLSWSALSSFRYDPEQWYKKYVLNQKQKATPKMEFGNTVGESLATEAPLVGGVVTYPVMEYELKVPFGDIYLLGYIDSYNTEKKLMREYKTSCNPKKWNQKSVDSHGQLTMYAFMLYLQHGIKPEDLTIHLDYIPVEENFDGTMSVCKPHKVYTYETKRTLRECLLFGTEINKTVKEMESYAQNHA